MQFGHPIADYQLIQLKLAKMEVARLNVQNMVFRTLELAAAGKQPTLAEASAMKWYSSQTATEVAMDAVQLFGGNGYMSEYPVEQLARDAKSLMIYAGSNEVQMTHVAKGLLGRLAERAGGARATTAATTWSLRREQRPQLLPGAAPAGGALAGRQVPGRDQQPAHGVHGGEDRVEQVLRRPRSTCAEPRRRRPPSRRLDDQHRLDARHVPAQFGIGARRDPQLDGGGERRALVHLPEDVEQLPDRVVGPDEPARSWLAPNSALRPARWVTAAVTRSSLVR